METNMTVQAARPLININTEILSLLYKDLAQPGVQQVGKALGTALGLANTFMMSFHVKNESARLHAEHHLEKLRKKLQDAKDEEVVPVPPEIGTGILERLTRTTNEKLSELFLELLATAAHVNTADLAHPRFTVVIESMTPDEASILEHFKDAQWRIPFLSASVQEHVEGDAPNEGRPIKTILRKKTLLESSPLLSIPSNASLYFNNLVALGLIHTEDGRKISDQGPYEVLTKKYHDLMQKEASWFATEHQVAVVVFTQYGYYELTEFGASFMKACYPDKERYYYRP